MNDYILLMHADAIESDKANSAAEWDRYLAELRASGRFLGGSAIGGGKCFAKSRVLREISAHIIGFIRVQADSIDDAQRFLNGNPIYDARGTVEIRELPHK